MKFQSRRAEAQTPEAVPRSFPIGAEVQNEGTHFRVWAPLLNTLEVVERQLGSSEAGRSVALTKQADGYFSGLVPGFADGQLYSFRADQSAQLLPDPASRYQPEGPHGPSQVVDAAKYHWRDRGHAGPPARGQVLYELHIGTFTPEGTYAAAAEQLGHLVELGVTIVELMPVAEFPGEFGWGYDGVALWAPTHLYGTPDDLRRFIDRAHGLGLSVILDVVYNHFGPDGCYLKSFSTDYFTDRYANEWGEALNFDGENSRPVREFFIENARYWISEYHFDGLRLDATHAILDASERHVIAEINQAARDAGRALDKRIFIAAENEKQHAEFAEDPERGGLGCDALWNDDFHHTARVAATGRREAYYQDYTGSPQELISALRWGYLYQGQYYYWQKQQRGHSALQLEAHQFITYLQNHDQIANTLTGERIAQIAEPALVRALTALWLLAPPTPLLFQGQEFGASAPFLFFAQHERDLASLVRKGRREFLVQFPSIATPGASDALADPGDRATFERCKLDLRERRTHDKWYALHKDLLALRRWDPAFQAQRADRMHGAVLSPRALVLR
ncbi:MAG TPA: malto-oligosyltrehalose trehalohydrolase, partial [Polyangiaceae bacterium]|nr:malto-oligosyltrehalose trehalohydrolase [Polyangiaceae bacterium]